MKLRDGLYHYKIFMPNIKIPNTQITLIYSNHAINASKNDRYGQILLPKTINPNAGKLIELEIKNNVIQKIVLRFKYSKDLDLIIVIGFNKIVKTVWLNKCEDNHSTLNYNNYVKCA